MACRESNGWRHDRQAEPRPSAAQLTGLAMTLDPGLAAEDFAGAGQRLDRLGGDRFARYGLTREDVTRLRELFAARPGTP